METAEEYDQQAAVQRIYYLAEQIAGIGSILEDPDMYRLIAAIGLSTDLHSLRNRQRRLNPIDPNHPYAGKEAATDLHGKHQGIYTRNLKNGRTEWLSAWRVLECYQNRVRGRYSLGAGEGSMQGVVGAGNRLLYDWQWGNATGKGELAIDNRGALRTDRKSKRHFRPPLPPPASGPPPPAAPPARGGCLRKRRAARRGAGMRGLDMRLRMGEGRTSGVPGRQGLETAGLKSTISNGISQRKGANDAAAARTTPTDPRWRGRRRTRISLGEGGQRQWEVERRPAEDGVKYG
jgi:hypothetical protein